MLLHTMNHHWAHLPDMVGLVGVSCILVAYYLLNAGRISSKSLSYQLINFCGAWLILFSLFFHWNTASVVIEIAWISISTMGMVKIYQSRKNAPFEGHQNLRLIKKTVTSVA